MEINNDDDYIGSIGSKYKILNENSEDDKGIKYLIIDKRNNILYVAKIENDWYGLKNEIEINEIIRTLKSQNIVKFVDSGEDLIEIEDSKTKKRKYIFFEFCAKGCLFKYLSITNGFKEIAVKIIFK